ncbi:hypothetical protein [Fibrivirga algicola]|uniref:DUF1361 domain-containing protein n=1 Tax=Fibrivirga algicola TaxID=2950420 RepID=A0ABX0QCU6_9BACT|nr:hypothetical protein [Fibrivirga algicola]NID10195.1 hypothetical protein [Fibrivirga algicola]
MNALYKLLSITCKKPYIFVLIGSLMVFNVLMNVPGLPTSTPSMQEISPTFIPFDLQAKGYTVDNFTHDLNGLGIEGRDIYRNFMLCDIFFPFIYALTFSSLIFLVFRDKKKWLKWLFLIPLLTGILDYIENIFIAMSFSNYPTPTPLAVSLASLATQIKMVFNVLLVLSLLVTLGTWAAALFKKQMSTSAQ